MVSVTDSFAESLWIRIYSSQNPRYCIQKCSPDSRHLMAIITPDGAYYYKDVRKMVTQEGFRSGCGDFQGR